MYSQKNKKPIPVFILQGTVKLNGKPLEGVSLELFNNENQAIKMLTAKNGLFSFQLNQSNTSIECALHIKKEGTVPGILTINTYTTNEKSNYVPYIFNLEINLTLKSASNSAVAQNLGEIKWNSERSIFDLEKGNNMMVEKGTDSIKIDSGKDSLTLIDRMNDIEAHQADSVAKQQLAKKETIDRFQLKVPDAIIQSNLNAEKDKENDKKELAGNNGRNSSTESKTAEPKSEMFYNISDKNTRKQKLDELVEQKTSEVVSKSTKLNGQVVKESVRSDENKQKAQRKNELSASKEKPGIKNKQTLTGTAKDEKAFALKKDEKIEKNKILTTNGMKISVPPDEKIQATVDIKKLSDNTGKAIIKTNQLNITATSLNDPNSFDGVEIFLIKNQKNKLLEINATMERKKAGNISKKYETSNILTSLLDMIEESEQK